MNENSATNQGEATDLLADDVRSYVQFCEAINERATELGSLALTESIKKLLASEFGLSTKKPIQLQLKHSQLSMACTFIKGCGLPKSIINKFQPTMGA